MAVRIHPVVGCSLLVVEGVRGGHTRVVAMVAGHSPAEGTAVHNSAVDRED